MVTEQYPTRLIHTTIPRSLRFVVEEERAYAAIEALSAECRQSIQLLEQSRSRCDLRITSRNLVEKFMERGKLQPGQEQDAGPNHSLHGWNIP